MDKLFAIGLAIAMTIPLLGKQYIGITLGILALIYRVPLWLGAGHQACAVLLLAASLLVAHQLRKSDHQPA